MSEEVKLERQLRIEEESSNLGVKRYREQRLPWGDKDKTRSNETDLPPGQVQLNRVMRPVTAEVKKWIEDVTKGQARRNAGLVKPILCLRPEVIAFLTSKIVINSLPQQVTVQKCAQGVTQAILDEINYNRFKEAAPGYLHVLKGDLNKSTTHRRRMAIVRNAMGKAGVEKVEMDLGTRVRLGAALINLFMQATGMVEITRVTLRKNKTINVLTGTKAIMQWLEGAHGRCELLSPVYLPMVVKPTPWSTPFDGGYLNKELCPLTLVKTRNRNYLEELSHWDMPEVYAAVNAVQETPWRVNRKVLEAMREVWDSASELGGLPARDDYPLPAKPHDIETNKESLIEWKHKAAEVHSVNHRLLGKRIAMSQKLWIAEKFLDEEAIYFPHVMDWRSRLYAVPALVNPQADDTGKALLEFAEGKPLGENGAYWLAVHLANLFGVDKVSLEERVQWVQDHTHEISLSAINPLVYTFWAGADKPYQALAACIEWEGFQREGEAYVSHLPIAQDGSCNGLQHFSMMLRDEVGGAAVNLVPQELPADIYQTVADVVSKKIDKGASKGNADAARWVGKISRSIAKRPVMTLPYGASRYGMGDQIKEEVRKSAEKGKVVIEGDDVGKSCAFLAGVIYDSIGEVVIAARQAMDWLQHTARVVAAEGLPVRWETPIGFPVLQEYRKPIEQLVETQMGKARLRMKVNDEGSKLDKRKQASGISPNFVHSLDASHMMATVNLCVLNGITSFAMVHDSYGTHACDIDNLNYLLRHSFVEQYTQDVLGRFRQELVEQVSPEIAEQIPPLPPTGKLDIEAVKDSQYFFA